MSAAPAFAAVIPVRNGLPDVLEALESVFAQQSPCAEVVVVDDASTDGTAEAVERRFGDRVTFVRGRFDGAAAARNAGWRAARAPWIAFLDADDVWRPEKLAVMGERCAAVPDAIWGFSDGAFRAFDGPEAPSWFALWADVPDEWSGSPLAALFEVNFVLTSSVVVRRDALEAEGGFDESLSHAEDVDLWIRLARRGRATASARPLVRYQHRAGGLTRQVEARLNGGATLFSRLAADRALDAPLRAAARRRASVYRYKLGVHALRAGRASEARRAFAAAWLWPARALPVLAGFALACLPRFVVQALRGRRAVTALGAPVVSVRRVALHVKGEGGA